MQRRYPFKSGSLPPCQRNQTICIDLTVDPPPPSPPIIFDDSQQNWERYRGIMDIILDNLNNQYENYRNNYESHPRYKIEKTIFWHNNYYAEDPHGERFEMKWIPVWLKRLNKLYEEDVRKNMDELKCKLQLPFNRRHRSASSERKQHGDGQGKLDEYLLLSERLEGSGELKEAKNNERSFSNANFKLLHENDDHQEIEYVVPLNVISVLKELTILEAELGNHGPKALELFARSESFEKIYKIPSNELLKDMEIFKFFEVAKETLENQLKNKKVNDWKVKNVKVSISNIEALLDRFAEHLKEGAQNNNANFKNLYQQIDIGLNCAGGGGVAEQYINPEVEGASVNKLGPVKNNLNNLMSMRKFSLGITASGTGNVLNEEFANISNNRNFNNKINSLLNVNENGNNLRDLRKIKALFKKKFLKSLYELKMRHRPRSIKRFDDNRKLNVGNTINNLRRKSQISDCSVLDNEKDRMNRHSSHTYIPQIDAGGIRIKF